MSPEKHKQVSDQCRVVAHLATAIAQVHTDKAALFAENGAPSLVDRVGKHTAYLMETLGNILNGMDAIDEDEDDWTYPIFREAHRLFPIEDSKP